jgi:predicted CopG family antitoxin
MHTISIDDETYEGLKALAQYENLPVHQVLKRRFAGFQNKSPSDAISQIDEVHVEDWQERAKRFRENLALKFPNVERSENNSPLTKEEALRRAAAIREYAASARPLNPNADFSRDAIYD